MQHLQNFHVYLMWHRVKTTNTVYIHNLYVEEVWKKGWPDMTPQECWRMGIGGWS